MKKIFILQGILTSLVFFTEGCASDDNYCCTSNDQCVPVHGKDTFCTVKDCGKCEAPEQPLQISADWKDAVVGKPYEVELTASGGFSPYEWVGLSKLKDPDNKLAWLILEKDPNDSSNSKAYLRNGNNNGQPLLPSTSTTDTDELTIEVTVRDNTQHGDSGGVAYSNIMKINKCGEASDCTDLPGDAACVDAACNAGTCEYHLKSTDYVCLAAGCRDGFIYNDKKCDASGACVAPNPEGTSCNGYQCADPTSCKTSCSSQTDCAGALLCKNDHTCTSPQAPGATCTVDGECASNSCVNVYGTGNKVCCENACNGICQACGGNGLCNQVPADDTRCGTISCSGKDTPCRTYWGLTANRCASFGVCKEVDSSSCVDFTKHPGAQCRASSGDPCDPAELCDSNGDCPTNAFLANGTHCGTGVCGACNNGVCSARQSDCDAGGGAANCGKCTGSGSTWNCTKDTTKCSGDCFLCNASGNYWVCTGNDTPCGTCRQCNGSGTVWSCNYVAPTVTLSATSPIPIETTTTLTWSGSCATSCVASGGDANWNQGKDFSGNQTQSPTVDTTYTLTCTSSPGNSTEVNTTVVVAQWKDTTGSGLSGESCDHWLASSGQSGIQGSGPRVNFNIVWYNGVLHNAGYILENYCTYIETCNTSGGDYYFGLACPSNTTTPDNGNDYENNPCLDWCQVFGDIRTAFKPTSASKNSGPYMLPLDGKTQTRQ